MSIFNIRRIIATAIAIAMLSIGAPAIASPSDDGGGSSPGVSTRGIDLFQGHAEYPHITKGNVSGHVFWTTGSANLKRYKATIKTWLQIKSNDGKWRTVATGTTVTVFPGGGKGKRGVANKICRKSSAHLWRVVGYVDLVGPNDTPVRAVSPGIPLPCTA